MARKTAVTEVDPEDDTEVDDDIEELVAEPADLEEVDDPDAVIDVDESDDDDDDVVIDDDDDDDDDEGETVPAAEAATDDDDDDDEDEEGDVEASLDVILKERLVQVDEDEEDEDEPNDPEDRAAPEAAKVLPKQPKEFVCQSCFLVKHPSQMSDSKRKLCRDCV
ncbi:MAG: DUF4193 family protein [Actinobacteria bacterium]|nr:DUF4193 family protein [Actinomycetota bacterium]